MNDFRESFPRENCGKVTAQREILCTKSGQEFLGILRPGNSQ